MTNKQYRSARIEFELTQAELSKMLGVSRETISARECGHVKITQEMSMAIEWVRDNVSAVEI